MGIHANILFANDKQVTESETLSHLLENSSADFSTAHNNNEIQIIVKEVNEKKQSLDKIRMIAGDISRYTLRQKIKTVHINHELLSKHFSNLVENEVIMAFVEGWHLGAYSFDVYKTKKSNEKTTLQFNDDKKIELAITNGIIRAEATAFSRDLMNEIPSTLNPETFPVILENEFKDSGVNVLIHNKEKLEELEMNGLLHVNRGSKFDPAFVELHYEGDPSKPLVALVGKGVTFDTGGISLKSGRDLSDMRMDMGGAAAVAGAVKLLAKSNAKVNVVGLIQIVENMPDNQSILPGDIIRYKNGHTVQVGNTDAEGRLILADGLIRAGELKSEYVVDIATLTGSIAAALGPKLGGVFGDEALANEMKKIGNENGDFVWPMPLVEDYDKTLKSNYADFSNISNQGEGGSITAALFLRRFVPASCKWLHVDMAGVMESKESGYYSNSATGYGARLLADYTQFVSR